MEDPRPQPHVQQPGVQASAPTPADETAVASHRSDDASPAIRPLFVPRGLVMLAALWVFCTWILLFGLRPPVQPQTASYGPTLEILFASIGAGIAIGWPLLRLSARPSSAPVLQSAFDALALAILLQVVVWPLRLVSNWTLPRTWMIVAALCVSIAFSGALLGLATGSTHRRTRTWAMAACVLLAAMPILVAIVGEGLAPTGSPVFGGGSTVSRESWRAYAEFLVPTSAPVLLGRCAEAVPLDPAPSEWNLIRLGGTACAALWVAAIVRSRFTRRIPLRPAAADPLS